MISKNAGPPGVPIGAAPNAVEHQYSKPGANHRQGTETLRPQLEGFVRSLFDPDDIVEIRRLPSGQSTWHTAEDLVVLEENLTQENTTQNIHVGVNPRVCKGDGSKAGECSGGCCGRCRLCVALARCLFVDLDKVTPDEAQFRLRESGLPAPTAIITSGNGVHFYWRLTAPMQDLDEWSDAQRILLTRVGGDPAVHDPPRIMRLPGFFNLKYDPPRPCTVVDAYPERVYPLDEFELRDARTGVPAAPRLATSESSPIREQTRNQTLFGIAAGMRARGCSEAGILAALLAENCERCVPRLDESEVRRIAKSAGRYPIGSVAIERNWRPFPIQVLPDPMRRFVVEGAEAMGCDPAYIALPTLASIAAVIGTTRRVQLKNAWSEAAMVWAVIVGHSGTLKSPAHDYALAPLKRLQAKRFREFRDAVATYEHDLLQYEGDLAQWKRKKNDERGEPPKKPKEPQAVRYLVSDPTIEALAPILLVNPRGVVLGRDELAAWLGSFERYRSGSKGSDAAQWLEMHRAGYVLVDRKSGFPRTIHVPLAGVSIAGTIQPETLQRALGREYFENGLAARLLMVMPPRRRKRWTEADVSQRTVKRFAQMIEKLLTLNHNCDDNGDPVPIDVPLDEDAHKAWIVFYDEHADRQAEVHEGDLAAAFAKLEGYAARFALLLHFMKWATLPKFQGDAIGEDSISAGVELARWFCDETERICAMFVDSDDEDSELIGHIRSLGGSVTIRDLQRGSRRFRMKSDEIRAMLDELVQRGVGFWEHLPPQAQGGHPIELFRLHGDSGDGDKTIDTGPPPRVVSPSPVSPVNITGSGNEKGELVEWTG